MRLIDADALKARFTEELFERSGLSAQGIIDEAPTIAPSGDLISRADAIEAVDRIKSTDNWQGAVIALIGSLPSADAVEVVRCKDCKYSFYDKDYESYNCRKHEYVECFDADDYCSWGERND